MPRDAGLPKETGLPKGWGAKLSGSRLAPYYFNEDSGSLWEPPAGTDPVKLEAYVRALYRARALAVGEIRAAHLLVKHTGSRNPSVTLTDAEGRRFKEPVTRSPEDGMLRIRAFQREIIEHDLQGKRNELKTKMHELDIKSGTEEYETEVKKHELAINKLKLEIEALEREASPADLQATAGARESDDKQSDVRARSLGELALTESDCSSRVARGDLGIFKYDDMQPAFSHAAYLLQPGQVSGIVSSDSGLHLIQRLEK